MISENKNAFFTDIIKSKANKINNHENKDDTIFVKHLKTIKIIFENLWGNAYIVLSGIYFCHIISV